MIDPDTTQEHIAPAGMKHHTIRDISINAKGKWYAALKMRHFIIKAHQDIFPELAEKMKQDPNNATNIYSAFVAMIPLQIKGALTPELKKMIMKAFKLGGGK